MIIITNMTQTRNFSTLIIFIFSCTAYLPFAAAQVTQNYQVYKLENKIGTEKVSIVGDNNNAAVDITIRTVDRGQALMLTASLTPNAAGSRYTSTGQTSRFKQEKIDKQYSPNEGFPLSQNGAIKLREMLIDYWIKAARPAVVKSALDGSAIRISEIANITDAYKADGWKAFLINNGLDEIFWTDAQGKAIFLTTIDSEGDKREVIDERYLSAFSKLNQQSTHHLLQAYMDNSSISFKKNPAIAILGGTIIDVTHNGDLQNNTMVLIIKGKIDYVGAINKSLIPPGARLIDATNKFLLPGLWDMHAHIFHPAYLQRELRSGVTSVRDMGNEFDFVKQLMDIVRKESTPAPNFYAAGLLDGKSPATLGAMLATNENEIKKNVRAYHDAGFKQIKVYGSVKKKDFNRIVEEAKRYDMDVVGHLPTGYTISYFINNGMRSISHINFFMNNINWSSTDLKTGNQNLLDSMRSHHTFLDPTLNVYRLMGDKKVAFYQKLIKLFADNHIPIVAGTDNEGTIADEIQNYMRCGMSPLDAIRSATIIPAEVMGEAQRSGSISQGKDGDILILEENPLLHINTLQHIPTIIRNQFVITN
ncbi:amidohydrolase family protein [Pedobacter sp. CFBP9032]|uniref:amidohydrolase family protein n=1 Tax=Pedobacter sp. CFBP9032 TaxID=3096539 RepID=UPI002A6AE336|nr:amidohydrolase family protein [Pedobacter sp. CFBP9032]MDY0905110.1 amidohydrolase family protein [Pedobacter sp. CFBP9032]